MPTQPPTIRKAGPDDLEAVYQMISALSNKTFDREDFSQVYTRNISSPDCFYCIAELEHKAIGFISLHIQQLLHHCGPVGEIQEFYIDPDYRGKGLGKLLMNEIKSYATAQGVKSLEVASNKRREENVAVYERLGFQLSHNKFTR
ncbi:MAG: GNAT family N-acetyltransferase [Bacteroidetes bacterium 43-16]|nr:MAG: GNAT family N-acetyltransferase [Bacteroidetes bacterium 43-16]